MTRGGSAAASSAAPRRKLPVTKCLSLLAHKSLPSANDADAKIKSSGLACHANLSAQRRQIKSPVGPISPMPGDCTATTTATPANWHGESRPRDKRCQISRGGSNPEAANNRRASGAVSAAIKAWATADKALPARTAAQ
jgi:hypothetical protein